MKFTAYLIECITNLHVGSGDAQYGIVDKLVQRDPVHDWPIIHASSLKGALRSHFNSNITLCNEVFGSEDTENGSGAYKFTAGELLAIPVRSSYQNYVLATSELNTKSINDKAKILVDREDLAPTVQDENKIYVNGNPTDVFAEAIRLSAAPPVPFNSPEGLSIHNFASFTTTNFKTICKNLPVIARNRMDEKKNLWYEEIVPHKTLFVTFIGVEESNINTTFEEKITQDIIQIGANASIGYGLCKFHKL